MHGFGEESGFTPAHTEIRINTQIGTPNAIYPHSETHPAMFPASHNRGTR
jgi:hypothetical protein